MITHQEREKITLDFSTRRRKKDVEVKFGGDDIRFLEKLKQMRYSYCMNILFISYSILF